MKKLENWKSFKNIPPHLEKFFWGLSILFIIVGSICSFMSVPLWYIIVWFFCALVNGLYGYVSYKKVDLEFGNKKKININN